MTQPSKEPHQGIISLTIRDRHALYMAYMPFIKNGGLFIPTTRPYLIGDEVFMVLNLVETKDRLPVAGRVVWITPPSAQGNRTAGIGVQMSDVDKGATRGTIEALLATALKLDRQTHTM